MPWHAAQRLPRTDSSSTRSTARSSSPRFSPQAAVSMPLLTAPVDAAPNRCHRANHWPCRRAQEAMGTMVDRHGGSRPAARETGQFPERGAFPRLQAGAGGRSNPSPAATAAPGGRSRGARPQRPAWLPACSNDGFQQVRAIEREPEIDALRRVFRGHFALHVRQHLRDGHAMRLGICRTDGIDQPWIGQELVHPRDQLDGLVGRPLRRSSISVTIPSKDARMGATTSRKQSSWSSPPHVPALAATRAGSRSLPPVEIITMSARRIASRTITDVRTSWSNDFAVPASVKSTKSMRRPVEAARPSRYSTGNGRHPPQ